MFHPIYISACVCSDILQGKSRGRKRSERYVRISAAVVLQAVKSLSFARDFAIEQFDASRRRCVADARAYGLHKRKRASGECGLSIVVRVRMLARTFTRNVKDATARAHEGARARATATGP